jgi:hypothetical protein
MFSFDVFSFIFMFSESNDDASVILGANAQDSNSKEVSVLLRVPEEKVLTVGGASNQGR